MKVNRVERIIIKDKRLDTLCFLTKNLYNYANYIIRQEFIATSKEKERGLKERANWIRYQELYKKVKDTIDYKSLPSQTAQQTLKLLDKNWLSFFKSIKDWKRNPDKYLGRPKLPRYKRKNGRAIAIFTNQQCKLQDGWILFPKFLKGFKVKTTVDNFQQIRIIPQATNFIIEIVYSKEVSEKKSDKKRIIGIDLGMRNIATITSNIGLRPIVCKGGILKSINQFYNKKKAKLQQIYDKQGIETGKKMQILTEKRNRKIDDQMHKISRFVVDYALQNEIGKIVFGYNPNWKQRINIGRRNNQSFVQIPFLKLIDQVNYKAEELNIEVAKQEESYTSKCSFLDNEAIEHHETYLGRRISRGLFKTEKGFIINCDVNGSLNIIRKSNPETIFARELLRDRGIGLMPLRITYPYKQNLLKLENKI